MVATDLRGELATFLRSRRARLTPGDVGLPGGERRRTPGLRREEVALLADVGTTWYTWLEQGRDIHPSPEVLESIGRALRLTPDERAHLFLLARGQPAPPRDPPPERVSPTVQRVLDALDPTPAYVMGRYFDALAWNRGANAVLDCFDDLQGRDLNGVWRMFTRADFRRLMVDWEGVAQRILAQFRARAGHLVDDPYMAALIADLTRVSPEFRRWWPQHAVQGRPDERKELMHPWEGLLVFQYATLGIEGSPDARLVVYTALDEQDTPAKLARLVTTGARSHTAAVHTSPQSIGSPDELVNAGEAVYLG